MNSAIAKRVRQRLEPRMTNLPFVERSCASPACLVDAQALGDGQRAHDAVLVKAVAPVRAAEVRAVARR